MKKTKALLILSLVFLISVIPFTNVNAHSVELDPNSLISLPMTIFGGKGTITIKDSETGYNLYYQAVEIPDEVNAQIEANESEGKAELDSIETELDTIKKETESLKTTLDNAKKAYNEKLNSGETDEELETLKSEYETARTNYNNKVDEYNNKVKEYRDKAEEIDKKTRELTPEYVEENWIKTEDGKFDIDISRFSGDKTFVVWAKLVSSDSTITYDEARYTASGTKASEVAVTGVNLDKTELTIEEEESYSLIATITPSNATNKRLVWTSDDEDVAKVENGKVTGLKVGTANITVTTEDGDFTETCKVTVVKKGSITKDNTTATTEIPQTGSTAIIVISLIGIITVIAVVAYRKSKSLNF